MTVGSPSPAGPSAAYLLAAAQIEPARTIAGEALDDAFEQRCRFDPALRAEGLEGIGKSLAQLQLLGLAAAFLARISMTGVASALRRLERAQRAKQQQVLEVLHDRLGRQHVRAELLLKLSSRAAVLAASPENAVCEAPATAGVSQIDGAVLQADPWAEAQGSVLLAEVVDRLDDIEPGERGIPSYLDLGYRRGPSAHDGVRMEFGHVDPVSLEGPGESIEVRVHERRQFLRRLVLRDRAEPRHIGGKTGSVDDLVDQIGSHATFSQVSNDLLRYVG